MKRADLTDSVHGLDFTDWTISPVGLRAQAKIAGIPYGRVWLMETECVTELGPPASVRSRFVATIGYERGRTVNTAPNDSAFGALSDAARAFPAIPAPGKRRGPPPPTLFGATKP